MVRLEYGFLVSEAFMAMTNLEAVQEAVSQSELPEPVKAFVAAHKEREKNNYAYAMRSFGKTGEHPKHWP